MATFKVLPKSLLITILTIASIGALPQLKSMDQRLKNYDTELTNDVTSKLPSLKAFSSKLDEIVFDISRCLKAHQRNPKAVVILIDQLNTLYRYDMAISLLRMGLEKAGIEIGDINLYSGYFGDDLYYDCLQSALRISYLIKSSDCAKIILYLAGNKAFDLISKRENLNGLTVFHNAVLHDNEAIDTNIFIDWAVATNKISRLLFLKAKNGRTAVHFAAYGGYVTIFKRLLEEADKIDGFVDLLLHDKDKKFNNRKHTVLDCARESLSKNCEAILDIIRFYSEKYQLTDLLVQLKNV